MKITIDETPEEHVLTDREGVELKSGEPFLFRVLVDMLAKPVGFAVQREPEITEERRQGQPEPEPDDWEFKLFQRLKKFYRFNNLVPAVRWEPNMEGTGTTTGRPCMTVSPITFEQFLLLLQRRLRWGSHGLADENASYARPGGPEPRRSGIWREDASGEWIPVTGRRA